MNDMIEKHKIINALHALDEIHEMVQDLIPTTTNKAKMNSAFGEIRYALQMNIKPN